MLFAKTHPLAGLQLSSVQPFVSSQTNGEPLWQLPLLHVSLLVQASPSSQGSALFAKTHPLAGLQLSSVQPFV